MGRWSLQVAGQKQKKNKTLVVTSILRAAAPPRLTAFHL